MVSKDDMIEIYDRDTYKVVQTIRVPYPVYVRNSDDDYKKKLQVLNIKTNRTESYFGVLIGHSLFQEEVESYYFIVYRRVSEFEYKLHK
jgi:hypothetical protein